MLKRPKLTLVNMLLRASATLATVFWVMMPVSQASAGLDEDDYELKKWEEAELALPPFPKPNGLVEFYVSASTENRFFIDPSSISIGNDGVIRYALVIVTGSGAKNISFEGFRCETRERRIYASGRPDGTWSMARQSRWERIREAVTNRHHAALFQDYFCPGGVIVSSAEEAKGALRRGRN